METDGPDGMPTLPPAYGQLLHHLSLTDAVETVQRVVARAFEAEAEAHSQHDHSLLRVLLCVRLSPGGAARAKDISTQMLMSTSHISRLIDRAEAAGLAERRIDPMDRRAHRVALTPAGEREIDAFVPHAVALLTRAIHDTLTPDQLHAALDALHRVAAAAERYAAERAAANGR